jgi:hypothetical protein
MSKRGKVGFLAYFKPRTLSSCRFLVSLSQDTIVLSHSTFDVMDTIILPIHLVKHNRAIINLPAKRKTFVRW